MVKIKLIEILFLAATFLPSIILHEYAHAAVAYLLGDPTAKLNNRLSFNPLNHLDFFGTLVIFFIKIGWAKPVPVNPRNFAYPRRDMALVALAGPLANFILAFLAGIALSSLDYFINFAALKNNIIYIAVFFEYLLKINVVLAIFNLIPIAPLDGSSIVRFLVPKKFRLYWHEFEEKGPLILIIIIGFQLFFNLSIFAYLIHYPASKLTSLILLICNFS